MNGLILLSIGLTALVGALCTLLYTRLSVLENSAKAASEQASRIEIKLYELVEVQSSIADRLDQLAVDVLHREIYQGPRDRHKLAIKAAVEGHGLSVLMKEHGLSADEASLILSLHAGNTEPAAAQSHSIIAPA